MKSSTLTIRLDPDLDRLLTKASRRSGRNSSQDDREALRRGTSVYVATGVEPMLPALLSSGVCSLRPGEDRKTVTVEMDLDPTGKVLSSRFYRSVIRSDLRLDYEQVERMFHGLEPIGSDLAQPLEWGRALAKTLRALRHEREDVGSRLQLPLLACVLHLEDGLAAGLRVVDHAFCDLAHEVAVPSGS